MIAESCAFSKDHLLLHHSVTVTEKENDDEVAIPNEWRPSIRIGREQERYSSRNQAQDPHQPSFSISSQTLSFNGVTIADDAELHVAHLADGSEIHVAIAGEAPAEQPPRPPNQGGNSRGSSATSTSDEIFVRFAFGEKPLGIPVAMNPAENARQLRSHMEETMGFKSPNAFMFFHKNKIIKEHRSFESQKIGNGAIIEVPKSSFKQTGTLSAEQMIQSVKDLALPEGEGPSASSSGEDEDDVKIRVMVEHGDERVASPYAVDVWAAQKVAKLREKLRTLTSIGLPAATYYFFHNGNLLNDELSFRDQNVGDGDLVKIGFLHA